MQKQGYYVLSWIKESSFLMCIRSVPSKTGEDYQKKNTWSWIDSLNLSVNLKSRCFRTEHGDIVDCIDIYKQRAFNHPMLKNHTIQLKPPTMPRENKEMKIGKCLRFHNMFLETYGAHKVNKVGSAG